MAGKRGYVWLHAKSPFVAVCLQRTADLLGKPREKHPYFSKILCGQTKISVPNTALPSLLSALRILLCQCCWFSISAVNLISPRVEILLFLVLGSGRNFPIVFTLNGHLVFPGSSETPLP